MLCEFFPFCRCALNVCDEYLIVAMFWLASRHPSGLGHCCWEIEIWTSMRKVLNMRFAARWLLFCSAVYIDFLTARCNCDIREWNVTSPFVSEHLPQVCFQIFFGNFLPKFSWQKFFRVFFTKYSLQIPFKILFTNILNLLLLLLGLALKVLHRCAVSLDSCMCCT